MLCEAMVDLRAAGRWSPSACLPSRISRSNCRFSSLFFFCKCFRHPLGERTTVVAHLVGRLAVHVGVARGDQVLGAPVHEIEVVEAYSALPPKSAPSHFTDSMMESTYSCSSFSGLVSSKRRLQLPPYSRARPKLSRMDFACPGAGSRLARAGSGCGSGRACPKRGRPSTTCLMKLLVEAACGALAGGLGIGNRLIFRRF